jgi:hypothetical protein
MTVPNWVRPARLGRSGVRTAGRTEGRRVLSRPSLHVGLGVALFAGKATKPNISTRQQDKTRVGRILRFVEGL